MVRSAPVFEHQGKRLMRKLIQPVVAAATFALAGMLASAPALAEYPEKPIKVIVPYSPGGTSDVITRIMTRHLEKALGQKVVIVNVNGGGGAVGWKRTQNARPDGYTLSSKSPVSPAPCSSGLRRNH